jgi:two-component system, sensor histidine kinase YesM
MIKRLLGSLSDYIANLSLKKKLLLTYFILIILPLGLLTSISYKRVSETVHTQTMHSARQVFDQASFFLSSKIDKAVDTSDSIILNKEINDIFKRTVKTEYEVPKQIDDLTKMTLFFRNLIRDGDVNGIKLYAKSGLIYSSEDTRDGLLESEENIDFYSVEAVKGENWYKLLGGYNGKIMWCPSWYFKYSGSDEQPVISAVRMVKNPNKLSENVGVLRIDILEKSVFDIIKDAKITNMGIVYIEDDQGVILSSSTLEETEKWSWVKSFYTGYKSKEFKTVELNGQKVIVGVRAINNTNWRMVSIIPLQEILMPGLGLRNEMFVLTFLIGIIAYLLAYYISNSSTKRIAQIIRRMKRVQNGDLDVIITKHGRDELGELIENFNFMIKKMTQLIEDQYRNGQEVKSAELKALQAQINPHFLYNTLDLINWMAIRNKVPEIGQMVHALAKFYKLSLSKGKDIITIEDEIAHVQTYVEIQNKRFDNGIKLELDIDDAIHEYKTLKILLQPIIENSILHGILQKESRAGTIKLSGRIEESGIVICIEDDGVGMSEEKVRDMLQADNAEKNHGYGVKNINERIKLYFGNQYGLTYASIPGEGTRVVMHIPEVK